MDLNKARRMITSTFDGPLRSRGFSEAKRLTFTRGSEDRVEIISFGIRRANSDSRSAQFCFSIGIGIRFEAIERVRKNRKADDQQLFSTIGSPLHLLRPERTYLEWCFDDLTPPSLDVMSEIDLYALPFFDRYRVIDDVLTALASEDPMNWFTLSAAQRGEILEAISEAKGI